MYGGGQSSDRDLDLEVEMSVRHLPGMLHGAGFKRSHRHSQNAFCKM